MAVWQALACLALVVLVGAAVQSVVGLGLGLLVAPVAGILEPAWVPVVPLTLALLISAVMVPGERERIDWRVVAWMLPARIPGTLLGVWLVVRSTEQQLQLAIGAMVLAGVLVSVRTVRVPMNPATMVLAGAAAGATGTATSIGGPPIALLLQHREAAQMRSTMSVFFFAGTVLSLVGLAVAGEVSAMSVRAAGILMPTVLLGFLAGRQLRLRLPQERLRLAVLAVCASAGLALLTRAALG
ncbi:MAG: sulfite exporter TauE/SafE family protein [Nocardioides sp.]